MIPAIQELNFPKKEGKQYATLSHATVNLADMGEKTISTQVKIDGEIVPDFSYDWAVEFQGEKYIMPLRIPQGAKENTSLNSTIDLTFQHWAIYQLKRWPFVTMQPIQTGTAIADEEVATVQLNLKDFCDLFGQVLEYYYGDTITIDLNPGWQGKEEATLITINHSYIWDVLIKFHELFAVRWAIEPRKGNDNRATGGERYVIKVGYPTTEADHIFEYGFEGGLLKLERQVQSDEIRNMIKGRGGETNIPLRYFKGKDPNNPDFKPDPDWVEELANIYLPNLMPATFRSYIQGWKAVHISKYPGYKAVGESNAYAPWAYRKGYTDTKFHPVEYVKDDESIAKYGPLQATLDNNDDIYPTIQGTGLDVAVAVEQIKSDDVEESVENDAKVSGFEDKGRLSKAEVLDGNGRKAVEIISGTFTVDKGKKANLDEGPKTFKVYKDEKYVGLTTEKGKLTLTVQKIPIEVGGYLVEAEDVSLAVVNALTGEERSASGIPEGVYFFRLRMTLHNTTKNKLKVVVSCESATVTSATLESDNWKNTFNIWVKNIWESSKQNDESDDAYAERVWKPILGDRQRNTAKVVFTSGALWHEDYEFTIVGFPAPDSSKSHNGDVSHWRIKLAKSEAELETTGLYVPSTQKQGKAGDTFAFVGTELTHVPYVVQAEIALDEWKKDHLGEVKEIKPTFVVTTDRVRLNNEGNPDALINQLRAGNSLRIADKRFVQPMGDRAYETLYLQSLTYTYREPSSDDAALNPDVEIILSNEYTTSANPVSVMQGEISALQKQVGSRSNLEQVVRAVGDRLYLRKDGVSDRSLSPTRFFSLLTSGDFRPGLVGGAGWGFYKDENGNWVLEADRVSVRQEMQVNTLVINQAEGRGGMEIDTAAFMEVTRVEETDNGYVCYFDQKDGSVANLFHVDDVAFCNRWTPENQELKFYKRRVVAVGVDSVTLTKPLNEAQRPAKWPDSGVNGTGVPAEKDNIIHFGNYTDKTRQYVKVRDVVGGGYERYIEELNSVNAKGVEYYFVGKQAGESRWFVGNKDLVPYSGKGDGSYIEYINRRFNLNNVTLSINTNIGDKTLAEYIKLVSPPVEQEDIEDFVNAIVDPRIDGVEGKLDGIQDQIDGVIETWFYNGVPTLTNYPASSWNTDALKTQHLGDLYYDNDTGTAYRFSQNAQGGYYWNTITDDAITKALAAAKAAQDTADRKRRVFTQQPVPPYDEGDLWVNATYGTQYSNDILRCLKSRATGSFAISDWGLASNYTDDSALNAFISDYQQTIKDIETQIDGKAETWYQPTDPSTVARPNGWLGEASAEHKGDLWYCTADIAGTNYRKGTTWYWDGSKWKKQDVPQSVFDTIDGKAEIFVSKPTSGYKENDLWFLDADYTLSGVAYKEGTLVVAIRNMGAAWSADDWVKKDRYTDDTLAQAAINRIAGFEYLKDAIANGATQFAGGLMLSSHIRLGEWDKSNPDKPVMSKVWAGMNGIYSNTALGRTIASWWGGDMVDLFDASDVRKKPRPANAATSLVRMNGSAYFADGNIGFRADGSGWLGNDLTGIKFDNNGSMTFGSGVRFDVENVEGLKTTLETLGNFNIGLSTLLIPCDANGVPLKGGWAEATKDDGTGTGGIKAKGIKAKVDFFSDGGVTALGHGSGTGGGGGTGGGLYGLMTEWTTESAATRSDALGANLGWELRTVKLDRAEAAGLYQPKGNYLTSHQSLAHLLKVDGSNGTASGVSELIRKLDGSVTAALTDATLIVTSNANGEASDHKYYRRPASALWSYVRGKGGSEWVTVSTAQTVTGKKTFSCAVADIITLHRSDANGGAFVKYQPKNQTVEEWLVGADINSNFVWARRNSGSDLTVMSLDRSGNLTAGSFIKSGGSDKQVLMADGSVQTHWKAADMTSANTDHGMITPKAMNVWATKTFVTALGTSGNYLTWTKNGVANNITVPYATGAGKLNASVPATLAMTHRETMAYYGMGSNTVADKPSGVDAFGMLSLRTADGWQGQLLMASNTATGLYWRTAMTLNGGWRTVLDSVNYAGILDSRYVTLSTVQTITGMKTFSHGLKIGNVLIEADANGDVRVNGNIYATGGVTALGSSGGSSSGGTGGTGASYSRLDSWADYTPAKDGYVLSAKLGRDLYDNKLSRVDAQSLFQPRGSYVTLDTTQTITGAKTFGSNKLRVVAGDPNYNHILRSTNTAIPTSERDYAWQIYHATEGSGFRGLSIWSYDGDSKVFNQVATFKAHGGNKLVVNGSVYATSLIRSGGTSAQFLKADGSVDSSSYLTTGAASSAYVKKAGDVMTGMLTTAGLVVPRDKYVYGVNEEGGSMLHFDGTRTVVGSIGEHSTAPTHLRSKTKHLTCGDNGTSYTVWDSGNDGSGSGLDADLLDGTHKSGLFTGLSNNGSTNNLSVTVGGVSKEVRVSAVGGYLTMTVSKNDNYGRPVYLLIADVTTWYNTTTSGAGDTGIVGYLYGRRGGNLAGTSVQKIIAWCSYNNSYYRLQSDTDDFNAVLPRIVRYDGKYYLALYMRGSGRDHCFIGFKSSNLLSTFITVNADSSGAFGGLTVVHSEEGMAHFGNASTATKLETARTLWGQPFDGTANVSGNMTGVGDINTASAPIGTVYSSNWFRSTGSSGWRSETYGGGWYMQDSTWIRSLGSKGLYMGTGTVRTDGSIVVGASEVFKVDPSGNVKANTLKIGRAEISWDEASTALKISTDVYSVKGVTALGSSGGATGGGGGASYGLIRNWGHTPAPTESTNDALGANLGWDLDRRLRSVESGAAVTVSTTGSGNAVTAISKSGTVITATKGATFLTAHQSLANYYTKSEVDAKDKRLVTYYPSRPTTANVNFGNNAGLYTFLATSSMTSGKPARDGHILHMEWDNSLSWAGQIAVPNGGDMQWRYQQGNTWQAWRTILDSVNYATTLDSRYYTKSEVDAKNYIKDRTNGTATYLNYGASGVTTASWLAAWNGYELRAMSPANVRACINAVSKAGDTMTGALQIDINSATKHLGFGRASYNYIGATASGGILGFTANGKALGVAANCDMIIEDNAVFPGTTNVGSLGKSAYRWANLYATTINVTSQALVGNLNADMLDGYHITNYQTGGWTGLKAYNEDSSTNYARYSHKLFKVDSPIDCILRFRVTSDINYPSYGEWVLRVNHTTNYGKCVILAPAGVNKNDIDLKVYVDSDFGVWVQTTAIWGNTFQFRVERGSLPEVISTVSGTPPNVMHTLVNVGSVRNDGTHGAMILQANAQSATKLQTARTLWGQSFDGSGNVSGSLSGVGTITGSGALVLVGNSHIYLKCGGSDAKSLVLNDSAFKPFDSAGGRLSLGSASARWSNTYSVLGNFSGLVTASAGIRIGEATISWDADRLALRIDRDVYSDRGVTALGSTGSQGGPSGGGYGRYEDETWAKAPASGDVLAAKLGVQLHNRVKSLEGKNYLDALNLTTTGGGNAVTAVSLSADKKSLTVTKGASFSLSDHRHGLLHHDFATTLASTTTDDGWSMINSSYHGFILKSLRMGSSAPGWVLGNHAAGVCFGGSDTKGVLSCSYSSPSVRFAGGNGSKPVWHLTLTGTSGATYNLANLLTSASAESTFVKKSGSTMTGRLVINGAAASQPLMVRGIVGQDGSGTVEALYLQYGANKPVFFGNGGTHNISADGSQYSGNSATATALKTARSINGTSFNGSADITTSHWGSARNISIADSASANTGTAVSVNGSANVTLRLPATIKAALAGNASSATQLQTARRLTIGGTGKDFNGTAALSWSLDEIGVYSKSAADGRFVNVTGDSMTGSLYMVNGSARVTVTDGAGADDGFGFVNVTRKNESANLAYFSMVKAGVGAYGIGVGPGGMILGSAWYSSDGKRKMNPWLTLDGSAMTVQGDILPDEDGKWDVGSRDWVYAGVYTARVVGNSDGDCLTLGVTEKLDAISIDYDGAVGIGGVSSPQYPLDVKGVMRADNILSNGGVTALKSTTTSDMRLKKVLGQLELRVEDIAGAPSFVHLWRHETPFGDEEQAGTSAQYWLGVLPQAVDRSGRWLALDYGKAALLSAIALARRSQTHEERIAELEAEVERLRGMLGKRSA